MTSSHRALDVVPWRQPRRNPHGAHAGAPATQRGARLHGRHARSRRRATGRVLALAVIAAIALLGAGLGAFATFVDSETSSVSIRAGNVDVEWATSGSAALTVPVSSIRPGQSTQRLIDLRNTGTLSVDELQLVVTATIANNSDGLQLAISGCSVPWSGTGSFSCGGVETVVSADRPLRATIALSQVAARQPGGTDHLRLIFRLPTTAPSSLESTSTNVTFEVLANRGAGRQR